MPTTDLRDRCERYSGNNKHIPGMRTGDESEALEEGPTCRLGALVNALPRIYQHSPAAMGHAGDSVTLPCRSQGHNVTREWFLNDERISSGTSYKVIPKFLCNIPLY